MKQDSFPSTISKQNQKKCKYYINDILNNSGIVVDKTKFCFAKYTDYIITKDLEFVKQVSFALESRFSLKNDIVVKELIAKLNNSEWKNHELIEQFRPEAGIQTKQKYDPITDVEKLNGEKSNHTINVEDGKVSLIFIWSIYWPVWRKQMQILSEIYNNNLADTDVKFIAVNVDSNSKSTALKMANSMNTKIEQYFVDVAKYPNHYLNKIIETNKPTTIVIGNDTTISFIGSVFEIDLEYFIKQEISKAPMRTDLGFNQNVKSDLEKKNLKTFIKNLENRTLMIKDKNMLLAKHLFNLTLRVTRVYNVGNMSYLKYSADLTYHCHALDEFEIDRTLLKGSAAVKKLNVLSNFVNTFEINSSDGDCYSCYKSLAGCVQYYCNFCKIYYCKACGDCVSNIFQPDILHQHFLYYLRPSSESFSKFVLYYNSEYEGISEYNYLQNNIVDREFIRTISVHFQVKCEGCFTFPIKSTRWKCVCCYFKNICSDCMLMCENRVGHFREICTNLLLVGCNPIKHIFQKVVFDGFIM